MRHLRFHVPQSLALVTFAQALALLPPSVVRAFENYEVYPAQITVALIAALSCEAAFGFWRKRGLSLHGVTTALVVTALIPADLAHWQLAMTVALGVILGELVFGGRGFNFLSAATVTLSLLVFSFPQVQLSPPSLSLALATLPGAVLLLTLGLISWRIVLIASLSSVALIALKGQQVDATAIGAALAFGLVFLICDPTSAAATNPGRWVYGALAGGLVVVFSNGAGITPEAVVFASLLASIFAPSIDHMVVLAHARRRKGAHV